MSALFLILLHLLTPPASKPVAERWIIDKSSVFVIQGKSNVAPFTCQTAQYLNKDTITIYRDANPHTPLSFSGGLKVLIRWFNCEQQVMTKEMWRTLKEKEKPEMKITLINVGRYERNGEKVLGVVEVELAGVVKRFEILFEVNNSHKNILSFSGIRQFRFSDFRLKAPNKLAGLIKVEEDILVRFKISLRAAS